MSEYTFLSKALIKVDEIKKDFASESSLFGALKRLKDNCKSNRKRYLCQSV